MTVLSGESLRKVMRRLPAPVTVVTTAFEDTFRGITIGSFTSTSLEPALVSLNVSRESPMVDLLSRSGRFVVHFLREDQSPMAERFAIPNMAGPGQFEGIPYSTSDEGLPLIGNVLARLECSLQDVHDAGDHVIVVGIVRRATELEDGRPLLYYDREYVSVASGAASDDRKPAGIRTS